MSTMSAANINGSGENKASNSSGGNHQMINERRVIVAGLFVGIVVSSLFLYHSAYPFEFMSSYSASDFILRFPKSQTSSLEGILKKAEMKNKTVIITTLSQAWAEPNSIFDIFLESFRLGNGTLELLNHVVVVSLDSKAHANCISKHPHCYALNTSGHDFSGSEKYFMTSDYVEMMWVRIPLLTDVLELGYNFVFTDTDILWLQNPFQHFFPDADFQIACDRFAGNSYDLNNEINGGFNYVKSNNRTIKFYKFWYTSRKIYPGLHDQDVLNKIKFHPYIGTVGLKIRFLDTKYIAGFCEVSKDFNAVCTMHANCCMGMEAKLRDLKLALQDWKTFMELPPNEKSLPRHWSVPRNCSLSAFHPPEENKKVSQLPATTTNSGS